MTQAGVSVGRRRARREQDWGDQTLREVPLVRTDRVPPPQPASGGVAGRRTVTITGRGAERSDATTSATRRRPVQRPHERPGFRPDRSALYAVLLGALLILVAATSAHAALRAARALRPAPAAAPVSLTVSPRAALRTTR